MSNPHDPGNIKRVIEALRQGGVIFKGTGKDVIDGSIVVRRRGRRPNPTRKATFAERMEAEAERRLMNEAPTNLNPFKR